MKCSCCGSRRIVDNFLPGLGSKCQRCVHGLSPRSSNGKGTKSKNDTQIALRAEWKSKVQNFNNEEDHHHSTGFHNLAKGLTNLWNRSSRYEILKLPLLKPNQCNNFLKYAKQKISTRARDPCVEEIIFGYSEGDRTHRYYNN